MSTSTKSPDFHQENSAQPVDIHSDDVLRVASLLENCGISLVVSGIGHMDTTRITASEAAKYAELGRTRYWAEYFGLTVEELADWVNSRGSVTCHGRTRSGGHCQNVVSRPGGIGLDPGEWVALRASKPMCRLHQKGGAK